MGRLPLAHQAGDQGEVLRRVTHLVKNAGLHLVPPALLWTVLAIEFPGGAAPCEL